MDLALRHGPFVSELDPAAIAAYARATNDPNRRCLEASAVPPAFIVTRTFAAQEAATATIPRAVFDAARTGVHGAHDITIHRPLVVGEQLATWSSLHGVRSSSAGTGVTLRIESLDGAGTPAVTELWTIMFVAATGFPDEGASVPDHTLAPDARAAPIGEVVRPVDDDQPTRYAEVSGDWSAHHFDAAVAQAGGFPGVFLHGLCTLAMAAGAVVAACADGEPARVARLAVRFSAPTHPGNDLVVGLFDGGRTPSGDHVIGFEATSGGATVLKHGRAELVGPR